MVLLNIIMQILIHYFVELIIRMLLIFLNWYVQLKATIGILHDGFDGF